MEIFESIGFKALKALEDIHLNIYIFKLRLLRVKYLSKFALAADGVFRSRTKSILISSQGLILLYQTNSLNNASQMSLFRETTFRYI